MKYNYNDYELLYAIKNGEEIALEIMLLKYDPYIIHYIKMNLGYFDEDLVQEGRIILYNSIYSYIESSNYSFFSYFQICFKRKINRLIYREKRYNKRILLSEYDEIYDSSSLNDKTSLFDMHMIPKSVFLDELDIRLYEECIISGLTLKDFSIKYALKYQSVNRKYHKLTNRIYESIRSYVI